MNSNGHRNSKQQRKQQNIDELPSSSLMVIGNNLNLHSHQTANMDGYRKTSSEIISEAKTILAGGEYGARLVNTRRPITPSDSRRQLYGIKAPPGRPPSAFSLQYLQNENLRALPILEPMQKQLYAITNDSSIETDVNNINSSPCSTGDGKNIQYKLPALTSPPLQLTTSFDNNFMKLDNPLKKKQSKSFDLPYKNSIKNLSSTESGTSFKMDVKYGKSELLPLNRNDDFLNSSKNKPNPFRGNETVDQILEMETTNKMVDGSDIDHQFKVITPNLLIRNNDLMAQSSTETLLDLLKAHSGIKECNDETVKHINSILVELYTRAKCSAKGNFRGQLLGNLYGLVECTSGKILLAVARIILSLCVTGSNLTGACKLVFKVARNEKNDYLFTDTDIPELLIDGLGRASPLDDPEACIYGYGAVRFLINSYQSNTNQISMPSSTQKLIANRLARHGSVQLMVLHLQILNEAGALQQLSGPPLHVLYQLAAAIRALAGIQQIKCNNDDKKENNLTDGKIISLELACPHLVKAAEIALGESEIQANIVRTLSVLSEHEDCSQALCEYSGRIGMLLGPCNNDKNFENGVPEKPLALLSRLGYILGNIMATFDKARTHFYQNDVAMEFLLDTLNIYSNRKLTNLNHTGDTIIDVLIKLVRVVANMSVNPDIGLQLGARPTLGKILLNLLITTNKNLCINLNPDIIELNQATLGALHNLCFYQDKIEENSYSQHGLNSMSKLLPQLSVELCNSINLKSFNICSEAARVLGNMTRNSLARNVFCANGGLKSIVKCLISNDYDLQSTSSGVLVNLLSDSECRQPFKELNGPFVLREIFHKAGEKKDWLLAGIICQALWNYLIDSENVIHSLGEIESDKISEQLADYLDDEKLFNGQTPDLIWENFAIVAADLLELIQLSLSPKNSLNNLTDYDNVDDDEDIDDVILKINSVND